VIEERRSANSQGNTGFSEQRQKRRRGYGLLNDEDALSPNIRLTGQSRRGVYTLPDSDDDQPNLVTRIRQGAFNRNSGNRSYAKAIGNLLPEIPRDELSRVMETLSSNDVLDLQRDLHDVYVAEGLQNQDSDSVRNFIRKNVVSKIEDSDKPWGRYVVGFVLVFMLLLWLSTNGTVNPETCSAHFNHDKYGKCKPESWSGTYDEWTSDQERQSRARDEWASEQERRQSKAREERERQERDQRERQERDQRERTRREKSRKAESGWSDNALRECMRDPEFARCVTGRCDRKTYKKLAKKYHPDKVTGSTECMAALIGNQKRYK
jgi:hypothetical protein